ncbi:MAG: hypothetical protein IH820_10530, partial [Bacteroidetes bacterium]|nr:hypothetical protein [Bacteroidota bacterium]
MATLTDPTLPVGDIRFFDNFIPALHDDEYMITVSQVLSGVPDAPSSFDATQNFLVQGPRFKLDPSEVHAMFPPANHSGMFEEQLPHIVLTKRALPWERYLDEDAKNTPWMALVLFDAGSGAKATAEVSSGGTITGLTLVSGGSGYQIAPVVTIAAPSTAGSTPATALATIDGSGAVTGFVITNAGAGYDSSNAPRVVIGSSTQAVAVTANDIITPGNDAN